FLVIVVLAILFPVRPQLQLHLDIPAVATGALEERHLSVLAHFAANKRSREGWLSLAQGKHHALHSAVFEPRHILLVHEFFAVLAELRRPDEASSHQSGRANRDQE